MMIMMMLKSNPIVRMENKNRSPNRDNYQRPAYLGISRVGAIKRIRNENKRESNRNKKKRMQVNNLLKANSPRKSGLISLTTTPLVPANLIDGLHPNWGEKHHSQHKANPLNDPSAIGFEKKILVFTRGNCCVCVRGNCSTNGRYDASVD